MKSFGVRTGMKMWHATWLFALALLSISIGAPPALAVSVFVQTADQSPSDPAFVEVSSPGDYDALADIGAGAFRARSISTPGSVDFAYAGTLSDLTLTNAGATAIVLPAGSLRVDIEAAYTRSVVSDSQLDSASHEVIVILGLRDAFVASGVVRHNVIERGGTPNLIETTLGTDEINNNGITYEIASETASKLEASIVAPEVTLGPGQSLALGVTLQTTAFLQGATTSTTDAFGPGLGVQLSLALPPGVTLSNDASVPLDWVTQSPTVPTLDDWAAQILIAALLAAGLFFLQGRRSFSEG